MKKNLTLLAFLLAIAFHGLAQDTLSGVVSRVAAPFFEQNVCDTRFAINTDNDTYYVMVDGYWPNPYLEDLVIHYDTIPVGNEIEVVGTIMEMEDGNGEAFHTIDIQELVHATYYYGIGFIDLYSNYATITCNVSQSNTCYLAIHGELQEALPIDFNGMTLGHDRYTFIGRIETWPEYDLPIFELTRVLPYSIETSANDVVVTNHELYLTTPCRDKSYLSWSDIDGTHFLTNNDQLHDENFFSQIWEGNVTTNIYGFENSHYDLFGAPFKTFEVISMETTGYRSIVGPIIAVGNPSTTSAPPIGMQCAVIHQNYEYLVANQQQWDHTPNQCIVENDTLPRNIEVKGYFNSSHLFLGNGIMPFMEILFDSISVNTKETKTVFGTLSQQTYPNYQEEPFFSIVNGEDVYYIGMGPFEDAISGYLIIGQDTINMGESLSVTGEIGQFYGTIASYPNYVFDIHNTIKINHVNSINALSETTNTHTGVFPNPSNGIIEILSDEPIDRISVYDVNGKLIVDKIGYSYQSTLNLKEFKGLLSIVTFHGKRKHIEKVVIR